MTTEAIQPDIFATGIVNLEACSQSQVGGGRYKLTKILGRGGMGIVWLARDELLNTDVALKFLPPQIRFDAVALDDLRRETSRSRRLTHPNVIRIHDFYEAKNEEAFVSMEFVEGANLAAVRVEKPQRVLTWEFLMPLVKQLCDGLEYAHSERVIHRDLKPANLMLDVKGRLKLADFGIARTLNDTMTRVSMNPGTSGTLLYMSPQQLEGKPPRVTDDIYALGATLYELLTSKPPFYSGDFLHQVRNVVPRPLPERLKELEISNQVPANVEKTILACLEKDETKRPQSVQAVATLLGLTSSVPSEKIPKFSRQFYFVILGAVLTAALISQFGFSRSPKKIPGNVVIASVVLPKSANADASKPIVSANANVPKPIIDPWPEIVDQTPAPKNEVAPVQQTESVAPAEKIVAPDATPGTSEEKISDAPAPAVENVSPKNFTALELVKLGNHYVSDNAHDQVIAIISDKTVGDLSPKNWRVIYHNEKASFNATEVQFADDKMIRVREPNRFLQIFSPGSSRALDLSKIKLDSDDALKILMDLPQVRAASVIAVQMELERGYGGMPVWTVNLFGESDSKLTDEKNLGTIQLLADSGKILKNTLAAKSE
jgi:serine/threonine protein kinase